MVWSSSRRKYRFNPGWERTRKLIGERDGWRCQWPVVDPVTGVSRVCGCPGNEVDHKRRAVDGVDDDSPSNLWVLCHEHHSFKTELESAEVRRVNRRRAKERARWEHPAYR